jgi:hypothetical protein
VRIEPLKQVPVLSPPNAGSAATVEIWVGIVGAFHYVDGTRDRLDLVVCHGRQIEEMHGG